MLSVRQVLPQSSILDSASVDNSSIPLASNAPGTSSAFYHVGNCDVKVEFEISDTLLKEKLAACADTSFSAPSAGETLPTVDTVDDWSSSSDAPVLQPPPNENHWENLADPDDPTVPSHAQRESIFFKDTCSSPAKAVLLFYINSGLFRFEQYKDYCAIHDNEPIDIDKLKQDIRDELLSDEEYDGIIRKFYKLHPYTNFDVKACSCCGLRQIERAEDPVISFVEMQLSNPLMALLQHTPAQALELTAFAESPQAKVTIPINESWETREVNLANVRSFYCQKQPNKPDQLWHLHPELVSLDGESSPYATLCPICHDSITSGKVPLLSIAAGVDFGLHSRIGLTEPNLHEQLMLARTRLYFAMVKISSNCRGQVNDNLSNPTRCHAILFPHNSPEVATYMHSSMLQGPGGILDEDALRKLLHMYMVDPMGNPDTLAREVIGTVNLLACPHVIAKWLVALKWSNPHYADLDVSSINSVVKEVIPLLNAHIRTATASITDPDAAAYEDTLGLDVAGVRNVEILQPCDVAARQQAVLHENSQSISNDVSYSYITNTDNAHHGEGQDTTDFRFAALTRISELDSAPLPLPNSVQDFIFNPQDIDSYLHHFPASKQHCTARGTMPLSDFTTDDLGIGTAFPHVFMLGRAYKRAPGSLSVAQRSHLLNQFHLTPSKDRRLMGFLFDVQQRSHVIKGVKAHVESNKKSIRVFKELMASDTLRAELRQAVKFPFSHSSKKLLRKYLSHLQFSSKNVSYGALEGVGLKHRLMGTACRYSAPTTFFTISPATFGNPRSIRMAVGIKSNDTFPAVFESGCPHGRDGDHFADNMLDGRVISEGTIAMPRSSHAEMAIANPVAFVQEYKTLISDILGILLNVNIEGPGYYSKLNSSSSRRSAYYRTKKGVFGHTFACPGVTEAHAKGTLHWHFLIFAGLSPYLLQRFAHLQNICDEISPVLDTMYVSELPADIQAAALVTRYLNSKRVQWSIPSAVCHSMAQPETTPSRKDPIASISRIASLPETQDTASWGSVAHSLPAGDAFSEQSGHFSSSADSSTQTSVSVHASIRDRNSTSTVTSEAFSEQNGSFSSSEHSSAEPSQSVHAVDNDVPAPPHARLEDRHSSTTSVSFPLPATDSSIFGCSQSTTASSEELGDQAMEDVFQLQASISKQAVDRIVAFQCSGSNFHVHQLTCHKGSQGKIGCRLCCPNASGSVTQPFKLSKLEPLPPGEIDANGNTPRITVPLEDRPRIWEAAPPSDIFGDGDTPRHRLVDMLDGTLDATVIVWETKRPVIDIPELRDDPSLQPDLRSHVSRVLRKLLTGVSTFAPSSNTVFWDWIDNIASQHELLELFLHIQKALPACNGFVAAFNPIAALCTGSHNNASLLGSLGQAKSALFYLIPYQGKTKFPLMGSLTLLDSAINHISKHKSTAADSGSISRNVIHLLQRTINRIHLHIEISDYQVAAALLELPSMIMTDQFAYGDPLSLHAFRSTLSFTPDSLPDLTGFPSGEEGQLSSPANGQITNAPLNSHPATIGDVDPAFPSTELLQANAGSLPLQTAAFDDTAPTVPQAPVTNCHLGTAIPVSGLGYVIKVKTCIGPPVEKRKKRHNKFSFLPASVLYLHRNVDLRCLNYYEYISCVQFVNQAPRQSAPSNPHLQVHFPLHEQFIGHKTSHHILRLKHYTPLFTGQTPRHPGKQPDSLTSKAGTRWKRSADSYARYYLCLFRPEDVTTSLPYSWESLTDFIAELQQDDSIISKFRLMTMHNHMSGMRTTEKVKKMTLQFRGRQRDLWTPAQRLAYEKHSMHAHTKIFTNQPVDEHFLGSDLPERTLKNMHKRLKHDHLQIQAMKGLPSAPSSANETNMTSAFALQHLTTVSDNIKEFKLCDTASANKRVASSSNTPSKRQKQAAFRDIRNNLKGSRASTHQQLKFFDTCCATLLNDAQPKDHLPKISIVHGPPGVGKSHLRKAVNDAVKASGLYNDNTAFNSIHAIDMEGGLTTCTDTGFNVQHHFNVVGDFTAKTQQQHKSKLGNCASQDAFNHIDEFGTQAPAHLARKSALCQVTGNCEDDFGGRNTILYGDLTQLGPVKVPLGLTQSVMDLYASPSIRTKIAMPGRKTIARSKTNKTGTLLPSQPVDQKSPNYIGTRLITSARWFELSLQQRSSDSEHNRIVHQLYKGLPITHADIKNKYKILRPEEVTQPDWINASILVATNRERLTLIQEKAVLFATFHKTHVVRWMRHWKHWEQEPTPNFHNSAMEDPIFWEHFVCGADGFLNETLSRELSLVNALPIKYHSIKFDSEHEKLLQHLIHCMPVGDIIDMPVPPAYIIVEVLPPDGIDADVLNALQNLSMDNVELLATRSQTRQAARILLPIQEHTNCSWDGTPVVIRGGPYFLPSRAKFCNRFPLELAFAITVHKAQGRTLRKVIIALSSCNVSNCAFSFQQLLVALSRVQKGDDIRLLLTGTTEEEKWNSIIFINTLKRDPSIAYFFAGFREIDKIQDELINEEWIADKWCQQLANLRFEQMIDQGLLS